jgi:putative methyltransferase (TIGR04325 family)
MRRLIAKVARRLVRPSETIEGYEHPELVNVVFRKTLAYTPDKEWPEIAGVSSVLDFGGGCGRHYKDANSASVRWAVVETPAMVARAKELSTERLQFFATIKEAADWLGTVDVVHSNGAIQNTPNPGEFLRQLCALRAKKMLWYRVLLGEGREVQTSYLGDNGPGSIPVREKLVQYERTKIPETEFHAAHDGYSLSDRGPDWFIFLGSQTSPHQSG